MTRKVRMSLGFGILFILLGMICMLFSLAGLIFRFIGPPVESLHTPDMQSQIVGWIIHVSVTLVGLLALWGGYRLIRAKS